MLVVVESFESAMRASLLRSKLDSKGRDDKWVSLQLGAWQ